MEEVPPGRTRFVKVNGRPVILANREGKIYALGGICPHQGNPFEGACLWDYLLDCPWHHFQFDIRTGENVYPRNVYPDGRPDLEREVGPVEAFPVRVEDGEVFVGINEREL